MADDRVEAAARLLVEARRSGNRLPRLPDDVAPRDEGEALRIQFATARSCGGTIGGWKAGLETSACLWQLVGSPARVAGGYGIEAEIGVRIGADLKGPGPHSYAEVLDAVEAGFVAIELFASRFVDVAAVPPLHALADDLSNCSFVVGADAMMWRRDLSEMRATVALDDAVVVDRTGGHAAGDPLRTLVALANWLPQHDLGLKRGDLVFTGSCTGVVQGRPGQTVKVAFEGYGEAQVQLT